VAGLRVDVAHGISKDPGLPDLTGPRPLNAPSPYRHRPELQPLFRSWRAILDSYPAEGFPGPRTAVGEVWYDVPETLAPYLRSGGLPQVFNFQLILAGWQAAEFRTAIDSALAVTGGSRAPWVIGNHDVARPASRYRLDEGFSPQTVSRLIALGDRNAEAAFSSYPANRTILEVMPKVRVPRKNVTPGEIVTVLSRRLGPGYQVESNGGRRVTVRKSPLMYASISISDQPGASVFGVHGGGFFFLRLVNTFGTARRVADALRRSPEFRSL
jgi:hypothetical protein